MSNLNYLQWPFFEARHGDLAQALDMAEVRRQAEASKQSTRAA